MANDTKDKLSGMVDWYNPWQLLETAKKTAISTIIGENADPRVVAAAAADGRFFDYSENLDFDLASEFKRDGGFRKNGYAREEIWVDYASDVGDGWNPTYSVAYAMAQA
jgi:hypothetical protein